MISVKNPGRKASSRCSVTSQRWRRTGLIPGVPGASRTPDVFMTSRTFFSDSGTASYCTSHKAGEGE